MPFARQPTVTAAYRVWIGTFKHTHTNLSLSLSEIYHIHFKFLTSQKPLWRESEPVDINSQRRESWKSASVVNAHLVDDPTMRQLGFALPRQQWSLLNRFRTGQGHCGACKMKWKLSDSDQCSCGETQTMSHIVESCPQTRLHCGLSKLHSADDDAAAWLTSYGS